MTDAQGKVSGAAEKVADWLKPRRNDDAGE